MADARPNVFQAYAVQEKSPFDLEKLSDRFRHRQTDWTIPEAFLCILVSASVADGQIHSEEQFTIVNVARKSRALASMGPNDLAAAFDSVQHRLQTRNTAFEEACQTIPADMCLPVFAQCADIVLSEGTLLAQEGVFLQDLARLLDISDEHARRVLEVLLLKNSY